MKGRKLPYGCLAFALACSWQHAVSSGPAAPAQDAQAAAPTQESSGFTVEVSFSPDALNKLVKRKETVVVAGLLSANPKVKAVKRVAFQMDDIGLGSVLVEVAPGQSARFGEIKLDEDVLAQTDGQQPQLLINVYSGRKSSRNNLLDCGVYSGSLQSAQGKSIPIACKLIGK